MDLIWTRAAGLVRSGWRATVALAVLAGLASGLAMAIVAAGRRTATAYDRFTAFADVPELLVNFCPPGYEPANEEALQPCLVYDARAERDRIVELPEVEAAARASFRGVTVAKASNPADTTSASTLVTYDPGIGNSLAGRYQVVEGRSAQRSEEILLNEVLAERAGLGVGDEVILTFWAAEELGQFGVDGATFHGPSVDVTVVGIGRAIPDLNAAQGEVPANEAAVVYGAPGLGAATAAAGGFSAVLVEATDDDSEAATAAIEAAFPSGNFNLASALEVDEIEPTRDAIRYEAHAAVALGAIVAVLAATFVAQAVARQSRREWSDGPTLRALGVVTRQAVAAAGLRGAAIGAPAAIVAVGVAIALSPLGPVGIGRLAEVDPGVRLDTPVLLVGATAVLVVCALCASAPLLSGRALRTVVPSARLPRPRRSFGLPPVLDVGVQLARDRRSAGVHAGTALASSVAAATAVVAAAYLTASFDDLSSTPMRFGAPWDLSVSAGVEGTEEIEAILARQELSQAIDQASVVTGTDLRIGEVAAWVHAYVPLPSVSDEVLPLPITAGRPPATRREIALGAVTMESAGLSLGDTVEVTGSTTGKDFEMTIVGTAIINDTFEPSPGRGGVVTPDFIAEAAPEISGDPVILSLTPGTDVEEFAQRVRSRYDGTVQRPLQQVAVRNLGRIRALPYVMAGVVVVLAAVSLVHALVLSISRNRRALATLKGLGFTRGQVGGAVAVHATAYVVLAAVVAVPFGLAAGRWGWGLVADSIGVPPVPVIPWVVVPAVVLGMALVANLAAAYPAWRAARLPTASALRAE